MLIKQVNLTELVKKDSKKSYRMILDEYACTPKQYI